MATPQLRILILTNDENSYSTKELEKEVKKAGHEPVVMNPSDLFCYISEHSGHDRLYHRKQESDKSERLYVKNFDACISRVSGSVYGHYILRQIANMNIFVTVTAEAAAICSDKFVCAQTVSKAKIATPRQILAVDSRDHAEMLTLIDKKYPIFCKLLRGSQGKGIMTLDNSISADMVLGSFSATKTPLVLQRFVNRESEKKRYDVRCICIGAETSDPILISYKRISKTSDPRANYSISKTGEKFELDEPTKQMVIKSCQAVGIGVAGVDLLFDEAEKKWYVLEINSNHGLQGVTSVTGKNVAREIVSYTIRECKRPSRNKPFFNHWAAFHFDQTPRPAANQPNQTFIKNLNHFKMDKKEDFKTFIEQLSDLKREINEFREQLGLSSLNEKLDDDPVNQAIKETNNAIKRVVSENFEADDQEFHKKLYENDPTVQYMRNANRILSGDFKTDPEPPQKPNRNG
jgi:ribosomal protein S6--L-glutamate ligase